MAKCIQLCQESVAICTASVKLMLLNSDHAKELCATCAKVCDKCAAECDNYPTMKECKDCATACRKVSKLCKEMKWYYATSPSGDNAEKKPSVSTVGGNYSGANINV
jgi:hypothetical protein